MNGPSRQAARASRRRLLAGLLGLSAALGPFPGTATAETPRAAPAGVVVFCIDTLRADRLHCYGHIRPTSPEIDRFARGATLFERAYSQASWSLPSYSSLFTSRYAPSSRDLTGPAGSAGGTVAAIFKAFGYRTAAFVGGGHLSPGFGLAGGFDTYWSSPVLGSLSKTVPAALEWLDGRAGGPPPGRPPPGRPFFLLVHGYDVHAPYVPPLGYAELYDRGYRGRVHQPGFLQPRLLAGIRGNRFEPADMAEFEPETSVDWSEPERRRAVLPPFEPRALPPSRPARAAVSAFASEQAVWPGPVQEGRSGLPFELPPLRVPLAPADLEHLRAHYDGAVTYADAWFGVFLRSLEARGLTSRTVVVLLGDHGEDLGEHGHFDHGNALHDNVLHVPLLVGGPGVPAGGRVARVVELLDVAPTLLELCGIPPNARHQGRSLAGLLGIGPESQAVAPAQPAAFSFDAGRASLRTQRWRFIRERTPGGAWGERLFDRSAEPNETVDVSSRYKDAAALLRSRLLDAAEGALDHSSPPGPGLSPEERAFMSLLGYW